MNWVQLALALISFGSSLLAWRKEKQAFDAATEKVVAEASIRLLEVTALGKELKARLETMSETERSDLWDRMIKDG